MTKEVRTILIVSRVLSTVFRSDYYPIVGFVILLTMTYLSLLPLAFKIWILAMVYVFTIGIPNLGIYFYRKIHGWSALELRLQHRRAVPYIMNILSYLCLLFILHQLHLPTFMGGIVVVSLLVQCACVVTNIWWKVSMHSAGSGAIIGALVAYSIIFMFNPVWWLCVAIMLSGLVMSSRLILRMHSFGQVLGGTAIGIVCGFVGIILT